MAGCGIVREKKTARLEFNDIKRHACLSSGVRGSRAELPAGLGALAGQTRAAAVARASFGSGKRFDLDSQAARRVTGNSGALGHVLSNDRARTNRRLGANVGHDKGAAPNPAMRSNGNPPKDTPIVGQVAGFVPPMLPPPAQNLHLTGE